MRIKILILLLTLFFLTPFVNYAETIVLKSGKTIEGKIVQKTDEFIKLELYGVSLTYYHDDIEQIKEAPASPASYKEIPSEAIEVTSDDIKEERIVLKNGKLIKGEIIEKTNEYLKVKAYGQVLTYQKEHVDNIDNKGWNGELLHSSGASRLDFDLPEGAYTRNRSNGVLEYVEHATQEIAINNIKFPQGTGLFFDENGKLKEARITATLQIGNISFPEKTQIYFSPEGKIKSVLSREHPVEINGINVSPESPVYFHENGAIERVIAGSEITINGKTFTAGEWIFFDKEGNPK